MGFIIVEVESPLSKPTALLVVLNSPFIVNCYGTSYVIVIMLIIMTAIVHFYSCRADNKS